MNNIEKLAKTHCIGTYQNSEDGERFYFRLQDLEAFAKALQSSEPVAEVIANPMYADSFIRPVIDWHIDETTLPIGTKLFTHPPASVSLEKYNKLLDAHKQISNIELANRIGGNTRTEYQANSNKAYRMQNISLQAIAEAEGKEG